MNLARRVHSGEGTPSDVQNLKIIEDRLVAHGLEPGLLTDPKPQPEPEWNGENVGMEMLRKMMADEAKQLPDPP
jgi:hypothetical protein